LHQRVRSPQGPRGRSRGLAANLGLAAAATSLGLLLAEAAVRCLTPIGPALLVTDAGVGKRFLPGFRGSVFADEAGRVVPVRINAAGFPGPEWPRERSPGSRRIAVLGDSMTAAIAVEEHLRFTSRLERGLAASAEEGRVEVMNLGVSSASTGSELVTWRRLAREYAPDVVILAFFAGNDLADNSARLTRAPRAYFDLDEAGRLLPGPEAPPTPAIVRWLDRHSRLYVWQKLATRRLRLGARSAADAIEPGQLIFATDGGTEVEHAWRVTAALVRALRQEVEATGARFVLVLVPCAEQVDDHLWSQLRRRGEEAGLRLTREEPSRRLGQMAAREGVAFLDLAPALSAAARRDADGAASAAELYLHGRFHFSAEGHRVAAEALQRFLEEG
jgi:lysophospholipase L1-like esterase